MSERARDKSIQEHDLVSQGVNLVGVLRPGRERIYRLSWSADGKRLAIPFSAGTAEIWSEERKLTALKGLDDSVIQVAWPADGNAVACTSSGASIRVFDSHTGELLSVLKGHRRSVNALAFAPNGQTLVSGSLDRTLIIWDLSAGTPRHILEGHQVSVLGVASSPDGRWIASASQDQTAIVWDAISGRIVHRLSGHTDMVLSVAFAPDSNTVSTASWDSTICVWDVGAGTLIRRIEGHNLGVNCVCISCDGAILASKSYDQTVRLWDLETGDNLAVIAEPTGREWPPGIAFHPASLTLATLGENDVVVRIWTLNANRLSKNVVRKKLSSYSNAKIVLVGDTGVGKSGLAMVLAGRPWTPTESSHGRSVWSLGAEVVISDNNRPHIRETFLWDLAGQPDYRLLHQLSLSEVAVALVVFDSRSHLDPFIGVRYWDRALRNAGIGRTSAHALIRILVAARADVGPIGIDAAAIEGILRGLGFEHYVETSSKEGWGMDRLFDILHRSISWELLPTVASTALFQDIKDFLGAERESGRVLSTVEDLHAAYRVKNAVPESEDIRAEFDTCLGRGEAQGLVRRLSFGGLVLLKPELLDGYASAIIRAVRGDPVGAGSIREEDVRAVHFPVADGERVAASDHESLIVLGTIEDLLHHEIALRETSEDGPYLVFPTLFTCASPPLPDRSEAVVFRFDGAVLNIYATLAVRLAHSGVFRKKEMWKNVATFEGAAGGVCGIALAELEEGRGQITLFFSGAGEESRFYFERYVHTHLQRRALPGSIARYEVTVCPGCKFVLPESIVRLRQNLGANTVLCPACERRIPLTDERELKSRDNPEMMSRADDAADTKRQQNEAVTVFAGKVATASYDVFFSYNRADRDGVLEIAGQLKDRGILPWIDVWEVRPGESFQKALEKQIKKTRTAAVFVGKNGVGPWQEREQEALLSQFVKRGCPVIPVVLREAKKLPKLPLFLGDIVWVDFRSDHALDRLVWGITGKRGVLTGMR